MNHKRALYFGFAMSSIGFITGAYISITAIGDYDTFLCYSTLASFLASYILWLLIIEKLMKPNPVLGVLLGVTSILVAHYLTFYLLLLSANIQYWVFSMKVGSLDGPPIDPIAGLNACLLYTSVSYMFFGWFTVPMGAVVGWLYSKNEVKEANPNLMDRPRILK